jgi:hypothetical protein
MDATFLDQKCEGSPAVCIWRDQLVVGWSHSLRSGAMCLAFGDAAAPGPFHPTIVPLPFVGNGDLAVASFADRIWLAYYDQSSALQITSSSDGTSFAAPVPLPFPRTSSGVSLATASDRLVVSCIGESNVVMVGSGNPDGVFDAPIVLDQRSDSPVLMTVILHPYYGELLLLIANWWDGVVLRSAPPKLLSSLDDAPVQVGQLDGPSLRASCVVTSPTAPRPCVAIAGLLSSGSIGLRFFDFDRTDFFAFPTLMGGPFSSSTPAITGYQGDVLIAYVETAISRRPCVGSWGSVFGAADLQTRLGQPCDPRACTDDPRLAWISRRS